MNENVWPSNLVISCFSNQLLEVRGGLHFHKGRRWNTFTRERITVLACVSGVMGACTLTYMVSGAILQWALAELILIEGVKPL